MSPSKRALIVIDVQNDYFPDGKFPLWNTAATLSHLTAAIAKAQALAMPVIVVQHIAGGDAPFFAAGSAGADIHPAILAAAPGATVVTKAYADSFAGTTLQAHLQRLDIEELLICGMMTQNCVTHTAISRAARQYRVAILPDCCTTVSQMLHALAVRAVSTRITPVALDPAW